MAIVKMSKIFLMGVNSHKEKILDALYKTGQVELSETEEFSDTFRVPLTDDINEITAIYDAIGRTIDFYNEVIDRAKGKPYYPENRQAQTLFIGYDDFVRAEEKADKVNACVLEAKGYITELADIKAERTKLSNLNSALLPYIAVKEKFSDFADTKTVKTFFGTVKKDNIEKIESALSEIPDTDLEVLFGGQISVILVLAHKDGASATAEILAGAEFSACPFDFNLSAKEKIAENDGRLKELSAREEEINKTVCKNSANLVDLKILFDYYGFAIEKAKEQESFSCTKATFILEGFVPTDKAEEVVNAVHLVSNAAFVEITEPKDDDTVPTLLKNNFIVRQTEFVTDMYSTPSYKEKDPNRAVFFFFMMFMGVIMADIGYGLIMIALGLMLAKRIKIDNGARRLWYNIAIGGFFAIIFGILFNSLFGVAVLPFSVLPSPVPSEGGQTGLMTILLGCLALGVIQIAFGYFMKALNLFMAGDIAGGIFDGLCWVLFFIGFVFAAFNFLIGYLMPDAFLAMNAGVKAFFDKTATPGLIVMLSALLLASLAAGRSEKGFGKVSKSFGAVYGLISIFSDILSYARLFGLMLSGMIIAKTFNDIGAGLFANGAIGYVFGGLVILIGHVFNIAMGVLGAYIHDSRLQYIEFFGKFYTGEGNKFKPMGSDLKYIYVIK